MSIDAFAQEIIDRLPAAMDVKGNVYNNIHFEYLNANNNVKIPSIIIEYPEANAIQSDDKTPIVNASFNCIPAYKHFKAFFEDGNTDPDSVDECISDLAEQLADSYTVQHISYIKHAATLNAFVENMNDTEYVLNNTYPELVDSEIYNQDPTNYGLCYSKTYDNGLNLDYIFSVVPPKSTFATNIFTDSPVLNEVSSKELIEKAIMNLNTKILEWIDVKPLTEIFVKNLISFEMPEDAFRQIMQSIKNDPDIKLDHAMHIVSIDAPVSVTSVLLSRTGLLYIAKMLGAKNKLQFFPINRNEIAVRKADTDDESIRQTDADKLINDFMAHNDPSRLVLSRMLTYDIQTETIS